MSRRWFKPGGDIAQIGQRSRSGTFFRWLVSMVVVAVVVAAATHYWSQYHYRRPTANQANAPASGRPAGSATASHAGANQPASPKTGASSAAGKGQQPPASGNNSPARDQTSDRNARKNRAKPKLQTDGRLGEVPLSESQRGNIPPTSHVADWCAHVAKLIESVVRNSCLRDGFVDTGHRSVEGRPIVMRRVQARSRPATGRILLLAATHGDEPSTIGTVFDWLNMMASKGTPYRWNIAPMLNPDGALHHPATRTNAHGVDLNRNLPTTGWAKKSQAYWRRVGFEKRRFPGKSPGSEPENRWLVDEIRNYRPDVIITLHAPYGVLDYDGAFPPPRKLGQLHLHRLGVYPGSLGNFASRMRGIPVMTIELEDARHRPSKEEMKAMWDDLNNWLDRYFRSVRQASSGDSADAG